MTDSDGQLALLSAAHYESKLGNLSGVVVMTGGYTLHICSQEMAESNCHHAKGTLLALHSWADPHAHTASAHLCCNALRGAVD